MDAEINKDEAFIFDIDGVLANNAWRQHLLQGEPKKAAWDIFCEASKDDPCFVDTVRLFATLHQAGYKCLLVTGRHEEWHHITLPWLEKIGIECDGIYARRGKDFRKDWEFKQEVYRTHIEPYYRVLGVFEDRTDCVKMWRSEGLTCYQPREESY